LHSRPITTRLAISRPLRPGLILGAAVVLPLLMFGLVVRQDHANRLQRLHEQSASATLVAREQALRLVGDGISALDRLEDLTGGLAWPQVQNRRTALQAEMRRIETSQDGTVCHLALVRPDGRIAVAGSAEIAPLADASGLEGLAAAREAPRGLFFEAPPAAIFTARAGLLITRGRAQDGRPFDGIAAAAVSAEAFLAGWREARAGEGGRLALVREDGTVLLREEGGAAPPRMALDGPSQRAFAAAASSPEPLEGDPFGDGAAQFVAWRQVGTLPLRIVHTIPAAPVQQQAIVTMVLAGIACFVVAVMLALVAFTVRRRMQRDQQTLARLEANAADLRDEIARREAAEDGLRNAQRLEGLGRLTGGVAHDFNNLLTAILGTVRALERHLGKQADDRTRRLLSAASTAVDRGARLNASLLAFARRQPLVLASLDSNTLLRDFRPLLRRALDESVTLELALDQKVPHCRSDAAQLEAALLNLAINARDAMPKGGKLRIVTRRAWLQEQALAGNPEAQPGPYVAIEVRDTGEGMEPEVRERAFEPFFTTKRNGQGTGLGLSQVFGFMRQIGGHVAIQSAPGRGTTVTLYLPLGSEVEAAPARPAILPPKAAVSGSGTSVLVVEDEPAVRIVAVEMLTDAGFTVLAAPDGPTALQLLREGVAADILFSDVVMPGGMTGVDLAREARKLRPQIGVLLASGYAAEALAKHGGAGEFELISKPYDTETVIGRIGALRRSQAAA
jgi:signal transduction histidine kinase